MALSISGKSQEELLELSKNDILNGFSPETAGGFQYNPRAFKQDNPQQGAGYPCNGGVKIDECNYIAKDAEELKKMTGEADPGEKIYVPSSAKLDVTGMDSYVPAENVTIASGRGGSTGKDGRPDGAVITSEGGKQKVFRLENKGARVTGFRFEFPQLKHAEWTSWRNPQLNVGVLIDADNCEVDNNQIRGFGHAGVAVGQSQFAKNAHIHHNDIRDNPMGGLGYGVVVWQGHPLIQYNYFDHNRHAVAGDGAPNCGYIARYNVCGPRTIGHVFDMHGSSWRDAGGKLAGKRISIHHNLFLPTREHTTGNGANAIKVRGIPSEGWQVNCNWFFHNKEPVHGGNGSSAINQIYQKFGDQFVGLERRENYYKRVDPAENFGPVRG